MTTPFRPARAVDAREDQIKFPVLLLPKIDGVRGLCFDKVLYGRSMKKIPNKHSQKLFGCAEYHGLDGELAVGSPADEDLCRATTRAVMTIKEEPNPVLWAFDDVTAPGGYLDRYEFLSTRVGDLRHYGHTHIELVPAVRADSLDFLLHQEQQWLDMGYEGMIGRSLTGPYKEGYSTVREGYYWRLKRFVDAEGVVIGLKQGMTNTNEAKTNELGLTKRSTHQANMIPTESVGTLVVRMLKDVAPFKEGQVVDVSPGKMTATEAEFYWKHQDKILGRIIKFKFFPKGIKDKPRFPTHQCFRDAIDL